MTIFEQIEAAIKTAMKNGDTTSRDCLRGIVSEIKNQTVNAGKELTDDVCLKVLQKSLKMHNDSIAQFEGAGRIDLVAKEKAEVEVINKFLPKMLTADETEKLVKATIDALEHQLAKPITKKEMGLVMKALSGNSVGSTIDMKLASKLVAQKLA